MHDRNAKKLCVELEDLVEEWDPGKDQGDAKTVLDRSNSHLLISVQAFVSIILEQINSEISTYVMLRKARL
jgi:hypothetical protein